MIRTNTCTGRARPAPRADARLAAVAVTAVAWLAVGVTPVAGDVLVRLIPEVAGPYGGEEVVNVEVVFENQGAQLTGIRNIQIDFTDTDPGLFLPGLFNFTLGAPGGYDATMPVVEWTAPTPSAYLTLDAGASLTVGNLDVRLPGTPGCYLLDAMNADEPNPAFGATLVWGPVGADIVWRAFTGELTGGTLFMLIGTGGEELCNGLDDDCDGEIDEGFSRVITNPATGEDIEVGPGDTCYTGEGECAVNGTIVCTADGTDLECQAKVPDPGVEGPPDDDSCFDFKDNDCDGLTDHQDPDCTADELCDGYDNDNDGQTDEEWPELGDTCFAGVGLCEKQGIIICTADGSGTECNVSPYAPKAEGPPGTSSCDNGLDDDCDGLVDLEDPDCQEDEKCDGIDNDGDGEVDEDFPTLGEVCTAGMGQCANEGVLVCHPDGSGVTCSASAGRKSPEGPAGCDCADGIDNDCDGLIDLDDPDCGGADLRVHCSLPQDCGPLGDDCLSWHTVQWDVLNGDGSETVFAELVALDEDGGFFASLPVEEGDTVRLASRVAAGDFTASTTEVLLDDDLFAGWADCMTGPDNGPYPAGCEVFDSDCDDDIDLADFAGVQEKFGQVLRFHEFYAPQVFLRVNANNGLNNVDAVCSNMPVLKVISPDEDVFSISEGGITRVKVAMPNIDESTLFVKVDGVDLLAGIGVDPATDFPGGPYGGFVKVNDCVVEVCNLIVDAAPADQLAANTLTMTLRNLCCGGHVLVVDGDKRPDSYPDDPDPDCLVDDLRDKGFSYGFGIDIFSPSPGDITPGGPTTVTGEACHGLELICPFPTTCDPLVRLNGAWFPLDPPIFTPGDGEDSGDRYVYPFEHDLTTRSYSESTLPGTFHPGPVRLYAEAWDVWGLAEHSEPVPFAIGPVRAPSRGPPLPDDPAVEKGTNLTISADGLATAFAALMTTALPGQLAVLMDDWVNKFKNHEQDIPMPGPLSDWTILINPVPDSGELGDEGFDVDVIADEDSIEVTAVLPDLISRVETAGQYRIKACGIFGHICICIAKFTLDAVFEITVQDAVISFTITEDDIVNNNPVEQDFAIEDDKVEVAKVGGDLDIGCIAGFVFKLINVVLDITNLVLKVLTFGQWDPGLGLGIPLEDYVEDVNFQELLGLVDADPLSLEFFQIDDADLPEFNTTLSFELAEADITPEGLALAYTTTFIPIQRDPEVGDIPGVPLTDAPLPLPLIPDADHITVSLPDDFFNQLFYSLTYSGQYITEFDTETDLVSLLPANCATVGAPEAWGQCEGLKGGDCDALADINPVAGFTCQVASDQAEELNILPTTPLLLHGRLDVPPKLVLTDDEATPGVLESILRIDQISVALLADRSGDGFGDDYDAVPDCTAALPATTTVCRMWDTCYDVDFDLELTLGNDGGVPVITPNVVGRTLSHGAGCGGGGGMPLPGTDAIDEIAQGAVLDELEQDVADNTPPIRLEGLDLGGLITFESPFLIQIENDGDASAGDYLGITGQP